MDRTTPLPTVLSNRHERRRWHALAVMLTVTGAVLASAPASAVSFSDVTGAAAGKKVYANAAGVLSVTPPGAGVNGYYVGHFVEADRLVLRWQEFQGAA